jgi:diguanylate cyclase (GGDEF)-like protein
LVAQGFALIGVLGIIDYLTGYEISFAIFYLIPVSMVAWSVGRRAGIAVALFSALTWLISNWAAGESHSNSFVPIWNMGTRLGFFLVVVFLLVELREMLEGEKGLARTDYLTGALNVRAFDEVARQEISRARRHERPFTVAYIDVDNFKTVNDSFGHSAGDALLRTTVKVIESDLRSNDVVARLGGDEFAILLPETAYGPAATVIRRIRNRLLEEAQKRQWPVTFSIGVLTCIEPPGTVEDVIRRADALMYSVKNEGKNAIKHEVLESVNA